ncbi:MAG: cytochrome c [Candidatus Obscuribacterales bacterium]
MSFRRVFTVVLSFFGTAVLLDGCVMSEEMKRIEIVKQAQKQRAESGSTNLNGEQLFFRSCNTCHPSGRANMGPSLENLSKDFPDDASLKAYLRKGKGMMPAQPKEIINDQELDNLVDYLRHLTFDK